MSKRVFDADGRDEHGFVQAVRIRAGLYVTSDGKRQIERSHDGRGWHVFEQDADGYRGEWCQWYPTLWQAIENYEGNQ